VLSPVFPDAPSDGDRLRLYHWLEALGERHEVHLACFIDPLRRADLGASALGTRLRSVHKVPWSRWRRRWAAGLRLLGPLPAGVSALTSKKMRILVDGLLTGDATDGFAKKKAPFDAVLSYRLKMAPYALRFKGPRFLDFTDSMTRYTERRAVDLALHRRPLKAVFARIQAARLAGYEAWCAGQFDVGFFNATQDCEAMQAMHPAAVASLKIAANGVDVGGLRRVQSRRTSSGPKDSVCELLFIGHLAYPPNIDAVEWFARKVLPLVQARIAQAVFTVVGGDAAPGLLALASFPGVRFVGFASDIRPYLSRAALSVCPVRTGAGRQNKLLEAFAAGLPAVGTSLAAEGAQAHDQEHMLIADGPEAFANAVVRLMEQPELGLRLAEQAQDLVRRLYVWPTNAAILEDAMLSVTRRCLW